jgi:Asp/Glu/hydantoin racemase
MISNFPAYKAAIERHAGKILSPHTELEIRGVEKGTSSLGFLSFEFLNNFMVFRSIVKALRKNFDAVAIGCFLDPILDELREILNVPVLSMGETGMHVASMLAKRFSIVQYSPQNLKRFSQLIEKYRFQSRCTLTSFELPFEELEQGFERPERVIDKFIEAGKRAVDEGAEALLPGCGCLNLILMENRVNQVEGVTVIDVSGALMKMAETMIVLQKVSGTQVSRKGFYESPRLEEVKNVLALYGVTD